MITPEEIAPALKGKSAKDQTALLRRILESAQRGQIPLSREEGKTITDFILASARGPVDETLWRQVNAIVRQYEQLLIARTTG